MITIKEAIIVEGKYDKMRLKSVVNATIIETNGFRIFKDKEKVNLIKQLAQKQGIIVLTDSDGAGFVIRNHLKNIVPKEQIKHAYIPQIKGKEKPPKFSAVSYVDQSLSSSFSAFGRTVIRTVTARWDSVSSTTTCRCS